MYFVFSKKSDTSGYAASGVLELACRRNSCRGQKIEEINIGTGEQLKNQGTRIIEIRALKV